jgi:tetratricopeptide (TPR) repeat protein
MVDGGRAVFVGESRKLALEQLTAEYRTCRDEAVARMVVVEGQPGVGKTRLVQELYAELAQNQPTPPFWPERIDVPADKVLAWRGRIAPEELRWKAEGEQTYVWVPIGCRLDLEGRPVRAVIPAVVLTETINEPTVTRFERRRRLLEAFVGLLILVGGVVTAALGIFAIGGIIAAIAGALIAFIALKDIAEPIKGFREVFRRRQRIHTDVVIRYSDTLKLLSAGAEARAAKFLREVGERGLPAVVVVDDAGWADEDTVKLVEQLLSRPAPLLVVATVRPDPFKRQWNRRNGFGGLARKFQGHTRTIRLEPLDEHELSEIVLARAPKTERSIAEAIARHAGGNPLVLGALLETTAIKDSLHVGAYRLDDPDAALADIQLDYEGVFERYWRQLDDESGLQQLLAIAWFHGFQVQPKSVAAGYEAVFGVDAERLVEAAHDPYWWLVRIHEDGSLDRFADRGLLDTIRRNLGNTLRPDQREDARRAMVRDLIERRARGAPWQRLSAEARRVLLTMHVTAAVEGVAERDREATLSGLELAELTDAPHEALKAAEYALRALEWAADDEPLMDRARTIAAERLLAVRPTNAQELLDAQLRYRATVFGEDDPKTLETRASLARAMQSAGRLDDAISNYEALVVRRERVFGADDPRTLGARTDVGLVLLEAERVDEAIAWFDALLADVQRLFGPDDPETLCAREMLAGALRFAHWPDALAVTEALVSDEERLFGADDHRTLSARTDLAAALADAGRWDEAIACYEKVARDMERTLGTDDPSTVHARVGLATALLGRSSDEAIAVFETLVDRDARVLGADHPDTLNMRDFLIDALLIAGKVDQAIALGKELLTDEERVLGREHPITFRTRASFSRALVDAGRHDEAVASYELLIADMERALGPLHPHTVRARHELGRAVSAAGNVETNIAIENLALADLDLLRYLREEWNVLSLNERDTWAQYFRDFLDFAELEGLTLNEEIATYESLVADRERLLGRHHPRTLETRKDLSLTLLCAGRRDDGIAQLEALVADQERTLGPDHPDTLSTRRLIGALLDSTNGATA